MSSNVGPAVSPMTTPTISSTDDEPGSYKKTYAIFEAAREGSMVDVVVESFSRRYLDRQHEIKRLTQDVKTFGELEAAADSLGAVLQGHGEGKITMTDKQKAFLMEAFELHDLKVKFGSKQLSVMSGDRNSEKAKTPLEVATKIAKGEDISKEDALKLYSFVTESKVDVIPAHATREALSQSMNRLRNELDEDSRRTMDQLTSIFPK